MASTYSKLKIELIGTGEQTGTWGTTTNNNLGSSSAGVYQGLEQAIVGMATLETADFTANSYTLPYNNDNNAQDFRALVLNITATLSGAGTLIVPTMQKPYIVMNNSSGGYAVTVKTVSGTGISVPNGKTMWVYNNGTDVVTAIDNLPSGTTVGGSAIGTGSVTSVAVSGGTTGLTTSGGPITSSGTITLAGTLAVANGGTGRTSLTSNNVILGAGTSQVGFVAPGTSGNVLTSNGTTWVSSPAGGGGGGTVTSVGLSTSLSGLSVSGSPVTTSGTLSLSGTLGTSSGGTGSTSLTGAGIVTTSDSGQTISGSKTFTGGLISANFNYSASTSSYGSVLSGGNYLQINFDIAGTRELDVSNSIMNIYEQTIPFADNSYSFGRNGNRWTAIWATNGTIQTSDQRLKTDITNSQLGLSFIQRLRPVSYKWIVGENVKDGYVEEDIYDENGNVVRTTRKPTVSPRAGVRTHYGLISQEVKQALDAENVGDFAGWILNDLDDPDSEQSLRYAEFISPMIKAIQELKQELDTVKAELEALKGG